MINANTDDYYRSVYDKIPVESINEANYTLIFIGMIIAFFVFCFILSTPIFAIQKDINKENENNTTSINLNESFKDTIRTKYANSYIYFPTDGIAHIKKIKYINSKPIKINILEISTKANPNLKIKPQIAGNKLYSKATLRKIAQKDNGIVAVNGGYFKPQTGVPLGALVINNKVLTGPIYNRVGIGFFEDNNEITYKMDNIALDIEAIGNKTNLKIDNINQPRMSQGYTLLYTSDWNNVSPKPPKNGYNALIRDKKIIKISANPIPMEKGDYVISTSIGKIKSIAQNKEINIKISPSGIMKNAKHIIGAGPYLIKNSQIYVDTKTQKLDAIAGKNPRTAIGYTESGNLIIVTIDGREEHSVGMTLYELARYMKSLGCINAMNFDGGSSSTMYVKGRIVNSTKYKEGIAVSNALVVMEDTYTGVQLSSL